MTVVQVRSHLISMNLSVCNTGLERSEGVVSVVGGIILVLGFITSISSISKLMIEIFLRGT